MTDPKESAESSTPSEQLRAELDRWRGELQGLVDEIKLKIHLGGMDAKDAWKELEPKIDTFEHKAQEASEELGRELKQVGTTLKSELQKLRDRLS